MLPFIFRVDMNMEAVRSSEMLVTTEQNAQPRRPKPISFCATTVVIHSLPEFLKSLTDAVVTPTAVLLTYLSLLLVLFSAFASFAHIRYCLMLSSQILAPYPHFGSQHMLLFQILPCPSFTSCLVFCLPIFPHALLLNITTCRFGSHDMPLQLSYKVLPHTLLSYLVL